MTPPSLFSDGGLPSGGSLIDDWGLLLRASSFSEQLDCLQMSSCGHKSKSASEPGFWILTFHNTVLTVCETSEAQGPHGKPFMPASTTLPLVAPDVSGKSNVRVRTRYWQICLLSLSYETSNTCTQGPSLLTSLVSCNISVCLAGLRQ